MNRRKRIAIYDRDGKRTGASTKTQAHTGDGLGIQAPCSLLLEKNKFSHIAAESIKNRVLFGTF